MPTWETIKNSIHEFPDNHPIIFTILCAPPLAVFMYFFYILMWAAFA